MPLPGGGVTALQSTPTAPPGGQRALWADAAKGLCVVLVVVWHVVWLHLVQIDWHVSIPAPQAWQAFVNALLPMRMPLFFTISGMFAANAVNRPWRTVARSRIAKYAYLFALWLGIHQGVVALVPVPFEERVHSVWDLVEQLTISPTTVWYLYALVVYFVLAKVLRKVPKAPVALLALALSAASSAGWLQFLNNHAEAYGNREAVFQNLVFFLCGMYFRPQVQSLAARTSWLRVGLFGLLDAAALGAMKHFEATTVIGVWPLASIAGTAFGITVIAKLSQWQPLGRPLASIGRRTLPIYVVHIPALMVVHWFVMTGPLPHASETVRLLVTIFEPVVLTAALVGFSLGLEALAERVRAGWLFDLPGGGKKAPAITEPDGESDTVPVPVVKVPMQISGRDEAWWSNPAMDPITRPIPVVAAPARSGRHALVVPGSDDDDLFAENPRRSRRDGIG